MYEKDIVDAEYEDITSPTNAPTVNVGTIGHIDHGKSTLMGSVATLTDVSDGDYSKFPQSEPPEDNLDKPKMTKNEVIDALVTAVADGHVSSKEAKRMKRDLGIFASDFTKKKQTQSKRKSKRASQKKARRKQR